ncbi:MAG: RecX family transcriptional regulator [Lachnospiraceae bacterium]|nr:RecX family transcriptional regulator [Lachnospiraceae bacterium]
MLITEIIELPRGRRKIRLSDDSLITLYKGELKQLNIEVGSELTDEAYEEIMTEILPKRAKLRALALLTKRTYTEKQIRDKLYDGGYSENIIDSTIEYIKDKNCLNDYQYCRTYLAYNSANKSKKRMISDLRSKGVSMDVIDKALSEAMDDGDMSDEEELIRKLIVKRHYDTESATYEERMKMMTYLYGKGFDTDVISRMI